MRNRRNESSVLTPGTTFIAEKKVGSRRHSSRARHAFLCSVVLLFSGVVFGQTNESEPNSSAGAGKILVHSKFGGQIFGFDIDQNGTEGLLSEAGGRVNAAVETFDQKTGKILEVVTKTETQDDFITMGVVGKSAGLVEHEHVLSFLHVKRTFHTVESSGFE